MSTDPDEKAAREALRITDAPQCRAHFGEDVGTAVVVTPRAQPQGGPVTLFPLLLLSCAAPDDECGEIIPVTTVAVSDDDGEEVVVGESCAVYDGTDGSEDVTPCCPDGYSFLAMADSSTVLCEEDCE